MSNGNLAARRTIYRNNRYRSITEARTAIFFDYLGFSYQYEPQSVRLSNGKLYLPDFYLDDFDIYVEVKPDNEIIRDVERFKADQLSADGNNVWLTRGHPRYGYPWFEHIGVSQRCMIANDFKHSKSFWVLQTDNAAYSPLTAGSHTRPCIFENDIVVQLALKQAETFKPSQQDFASFGAVSEMIMGDVRRTTMNK